MNSRRYYNTLYILNQVELFRNEPKLLATWLYAKPDFGKKPPVIPTDNIIYWILRLGGYIRT